MASDDQNKKEAMASEQERRDPQRGHNWKKEQSGDRLWFLVELVVLAFKLKSSLLKDGAREGRKEQLAQNFYFTHTPPT